MRVLPRRSAPRLAVAALVLTVAAGCGLVGGDAEDPATNAVAVQASAEPTTADTLLEAEPDETGTTTPPTRAAPSNAAPAKKSAVKPSPTRSKRTAKPTRNPTTEPTEPQIWDQKPDCATYEGKAVSKKKAKAALTAAAGRVYWQTSAPKLRVPARLIKVVAWQESGWQSNIVNCDGGFGLMQAMPDTVSFMNQRFGLSYDVRDYRDNAFVGANYLAWLTKKFGDNYFKGSYNLSAGACRSHSDMCLLNMVISAYNAGDGSVEQARPGGDLPNPAYVDSVRSLMRSCPCDRY